MKIRFYVVLCFIFCGLHAMEEDKKRKAPTSENNPEKRLRLTDASWDDLPSELQQLVLEIVAADKDPVIGLKGFNTLMNLNTTLYSLGHNKALLKRIAARWALGDNDRAFKIYAATAGGDSGAQLPYATGEVFDSSDCQESVSIPVALFNELHKQSPVHEGDRHYYPLMYNAVTKGNVPVLKRLLKTGFINPAILYLLSKGNRQVLKKLFMANPPWANNMFNTSNLDSCFINAILLADRARAKALHASGADINAFVDEGITGLMCASANGDLEMINYLLDNGARINDHDRGVYWTALMVAAQSGHYESVKQLIAKGADVNKAAGNGRTALMMASSEGHLSIVQLLLAAQADPNAKDNVDRTALMYAIDKGYYSVVAELLGHSVEINNKDITNATPLKIAVDKGQTAIVKLLIEHKATDSNPISLLTLAVSKGYAQIFSMLLKEFNHAKNMLSSDNYTLLMIAAHKGHSEIVRLLTENGASIDAQEEKKKMTALMYAAARGNAECLELLLKAKATTELKDNHEATALMWAACNGHLACVKLLIEYGADYHAEDKEANALMRAAESGRTSVVELLSHYIDPMLTDKQGQTARDYALKNGHQYTALKLTNSGKTETEKQHAF